LYQTRFLKTHKKLDGFLIVGHLTAIILNWYRYIIESSMSTNRNSVQEQMSQHFKEMAGKQGDETKRVIANTFSKNADILEDLYSIIERLTSELREAKNQIQHLDSKIMQLSSSLATQPNTEEEKS
jgi:mannitol-1-phosphate/altronate dehydrogenase